MGTALPIGAKRGTNRVNVAETISFVVPAYNEEKHLAQTLTAIFAEVKRGGHQAEVIVVNNASTDGTGALAASFPEVIVVDEPQKGLVQARRAGFQRATGDLIANVDADTIVTKGWLERVMKEFERHPRLVALSGPYIYYDLSKATRVAVRAFYCMGYVFYILNRFVFRVGSLLQGGNFVVRRTALEEIGGFNPLFSFYGEDTDLARRLHAVGAVKFTFRLPALSSGRRLAGEGVVRIGTRYFMNFVWATFFHKPFTDAWLDIRTDP
jgi:cellulose synthase/poly-beta-1,6-N-acetylglucosamine synthase-like glycosyltransferase